MNQKLDIASIYNLSPMQEGMLFHYLINPESSAYFQQSSCTIVGSINLEILEKSFSFLINRHDILKTNFLYENLKNPKQIVFKRRDVNILFEDISDLDELKKKSFIQDFKERDRKKGFDLAKDNLLRMSVIKLCDQNFEIIWSFHHILMDGWCIQSIVKELFATYDKFKKGIPASKNKPSPYSNYIKWLEAQDYGEARNFWEKYLEGYEGTASLPKLNINTSSHYSLVEKSLILDKLLTKNLVEIAKANKITLNTLFQVAWSILLFKYNNKNDVVFGMVTTERPEEIPGIEDMIGLFINTIPCRVSFDAGDTISDLFKKIHNTYIKKQNYSFFPLAEIQSLSHMNRDLVDHIFTFQNIGNSNLDSFANDEFEVIESGDFEQTNYDFNITIIPGEQIEIRFEYNSLVYDQTIIENALNHLENLILSIITDPNGLISELDIMSQTEKQKLLEFKKIPLSEYKNIQMLLEGQAEQNPKKIAVRFEKYALSYKDLNEKANQLARVLRKKGVKPNVLVSVMLDRSLEMIVSVFGVLKAGGAFVPIDPEYPKERIEYLLGNSNSSILITEDKYLDSISFQGTKISVNDNQIDSEDSNNLSNINQSSDLAYVIFTSGSTGRPKGVMVEHQSYLNIVQAWKKEYNLENFQVRLLQMASFSFDVFAGDIGRTILCGGELIICPSDVRIDPPMLYQYVKKYEINVLESTPKLVIPLMHYVWDNNLNINFMRLIILGSDICQLSDYKMLLDRFGENTRILNSYGVTEATIDSSYYEENILNVTSAGYTPIGKPLPNVSMYILDSNLKLQPIGVVGELYISGAGVARGYLDNRELTEEKFIENPFQHNTKMYRTGDLARLLPDGNIEFLGRMDNQVKIRGIRIELGEIENQLLKHTDINHAAVIANTDSLGENFLCAYIVSNKVLNRKEIRDFLSAFLPDQMIPSRFMFIDSLPLSNNGKVDRKALPEPTILSSETDYVAPNTMIEQKLVEIWQDVLEVERVGLTDHFFDLGGHSLKAIKLVARISKEFEINFSLRDVFKILTLGEMATLIASSQNSIYSAIEPVLKADFYPVSSAQKRLLIINQLEGLGTAYNIPFLLKLKGAVDVRRLEYVFQTLIQRHDAFRTSFEFIEGQPVQKVHDTITLDMQFLHLQSEDELNQFIADYVQPFNLQEAPLLRVALAKVEENTYYLLGDMHHIISDGTSVGVLVDEFMVLYEGEELEPLRIQYKDYAAWQEQLAYDGTLLKQEAYWLKQFEGEAPVLNLPTDFPRPQIQSYEGNNFSIQLDKELISKLYKRISETETTLYMTMLAAYSILLSKYTDQEDIVIGSPIAGRSHGDLENLIGMFVGTLPMRSFPEGKKTFKQFIQEVKDNTLEAFENQDYPYEELIEKINIERDLSRNPLFETMLVVQNMEIKDMVLEGLKIEPVSIDSKISKFDITVAITENEEGIELEVEYATKLFKKETMERFIKHYIHILHEVTNDIDVKIADITMLSSEERNRILYDFNDTKCDYPRDKTIQALFEEQVQHRPDQIAVVEDGTQVSYKELNEKANHLAYLLKEKGVRPDDVVAIMEERSIEMIIGMVAILKAGAAYLPLDPDYPIERIKYMLEDSEACLLLTNRAFSQKLTTSIDMIDLVPVEDMNKETINPKSENVPTHLAYMMYTSGSTGKPKGVMVEHRNVVRLVKNTNYITFEEGDRLLQTAAQVFDASIFEIWGALLNGLELYIIDKLSLLDTKELQRKLETYQITKLWLTAPLFDQLASENPKIFKHLKTLIVGGDVLSAKNINLVRRACPNIQIVNGYGPSENTTFSCCYEIDKEYTSQIPIGRPINNSTAYIMDSYGNLVPIGVPGEIWVGGDGVARGYKNLGSLTKERFIDNPFKEEERIYRTGDRAKWSSDGNIEFIGRVDNQIKIRGFRIEVTEIEKVILNHDLVKEVIVLPIEQNNNNKYLCAYLVGEEVLTTEEVKEYLLNKIPEYMVPSGFVIMEKLPLNQNGKVDRKALPEPIILSSETDYVAPNTMIEQKLVEIWQDVLEVKRVGLTDHFFDLGGHSLKAIKLVARINKEFEINFSLRDVFKTLTLGEMATLIASSQNSIYSAIEPVLKADFYPVSSAQKRLLIINQLEGLGTAYNIPFLLKLEGAVDVRRIEYVFQTLIQRHDAFRTSFEFVEGQPVQKVHDTIKLDMHFLDLQSEDKLNQFIADYVQPFNLQEAPLLRVALAKVGVNTYYLIGDMHHIISDGTSVGVLVDEFMALYEGEELEPLRIQYKDYAAWQEQLAYDGTLLKQEAYWLKQFEGEVPVLNLPTDYPRPQIQSYEGNNFSIQLDKELISKLYKRISETETTLYMTMLAAYSILLSKYTDQEDIIIGSPIAGRSHGDLENLIGMFVGTLPMRSFPEGKKTFKQFIQEVKDNTLEAFENQDYPYEELIEKINIERDLSRNPLFETMLVVQNMEIKDVVLEGLKIEPVSIDSKISKFDITVAITENEEGIELEVEYATKLFEKETMERFIQHYIHILHEVTNDIDVKIADITMLTSEERNRILYDFNDTKCEYPRDKTIQALFEEQVQHRPDHIAVVKDGTQVSYKELNEKANHLACLLKEKGVRLDDVVAIMEERSIEMIIGMVAILKAGAAYLPIDPDYPIERIEYMLEDSEACLVLTNRAFSQKITTSIEMIDLVPVRDMNKETINPKSDNVPTHLAYMMYTSGSTGKPKGVMVEHRNVVRLVKNTNYITFEEGDRLLQTIAQVFDPSTFEIWGALLNGIELYIVDKLTLLSPNELETMLKNNKITILVLPAPLFDQMVQENPNMFNKLKFLMVGGDVLSPKRIKEVRQICPSLKILNAYGPTENTVTSTCYRVDENHDFNIPIGRPISNSTAYILDSNGQPVPIGVAGELWVGGDGVARGYKNLESLTRERFIPSPFNEGERLYRTGDRTKWLIDGNISFIGRMDHQIKIRGFRVEVSEIERTILNNALINESVVLVKNEAGQKSLCAFIVPKEELKVEDIRQYLTNKLPEYMIPSRFIFIDNLPLNSNGKVDKKLLESYDFSADEESIYVAPKNNVEEKVAHVWREILCVEKISTNDNFFHIGGNSLKSIQLVSKLMDLGYELRINDVFEYQTILNLSNVINSRIQNSKKELIKQTDQIELLIKDKFGVKCHYSQVQVNNKNYYVLFVNLLNKELASKIQVLIEQNVLDEIRPHYIVPMTGKVSNKLNEDEFSKILNLKNNVTKECLDELLVSIGKMNSEFENQIVQGKVLETYETSPSQEYHLTHKDISGTILKWDKYLKKDLLEKVLIEILSTEEVMRSVLISREGEHRWELYEKPNKVSIPYIDISSYKQDAKDKIISLVMTNFFLPNYEEKDSLMYRALLIKENLREFKLILPFSHTIFDYMSSEILKTKFINYYDSLENGQHLNVETSNSFTSFISQIRKGPKDLTDEELCELFNLEEFGNLSKEIKAFVESQDNSDCSVIHYNIHTKGINKPEDMLDLSMKILEEYIKGKFNVSKAPFWVTNYGRKFEEKTYFNTVGEFIDYIPFLVDSKNDNQNINLKEILTTVSEKNIHFSNLMFNSKMQSLYPNTIKKLLSIFNQIPINFNYLGEIDEDYDLGNANIGDVNSEDRSRIVCMVSHFKGKLSLTIILPYVVNQQLVKQDLDRASEFVLLHSQIKDFVTS